MSERGILRRLLASAIADDPEAGYSLLDRLDGLPRVVQPSFVPAASARVIPISSAAGIQSWINHHKES